MSMESELRRSQNEIFSLRMDYDAKVNELELLRESFEERNRIEEQQTFLEEKRRKEVETDHNCVVNGLTDEIIELRKTCSRLESDLAELEGKSLKTDIMNEHSHIKTVMDIETKALRESEKLATERMEVAISRCKTLEVENHRVRSLLMDQQVILAEMDALRTALSEQQVARALANDLVQDLQEQLNISNAKLENKKVSSGSARYSNLSPRLRGSSGGLSQFAEILQQRNRPASNSSSSSNDSMESITDETAPLDRIMRKNGFSFVPDSHTAQETANKLEMWRNKTREATEMAERTREMLDQERHDLSTCKMKLSYAESNVSRLRSEVEHLQDEVAERDAAATRSKQDVSRVRTQLDLTRAALIETRGELERTKQVLETANDNKSHLESVRINLENSIQSLKRELQDSREALSNANANIAIERRRWKDEEAAHKDKLLVIEADVSSRWQPTITRLENDIRERETELEDMRTQLCLLQKRLDASLLVPGALRTSSAFSGVDISAGREGELLRKQDDLQSSLNAEKRKIRSLEIHLEGAHQKHSRDAGIIEDIQTQLRQVEQQSTQFKTQLMISTASEHSLKAEVQNERTRIQKLSIALAESRQGGVGGCRIDENASNLIKRHAISLSKSLETAQSSLKDLGDRFEAVVNEKHELVNVIQASLNNSVLRSDLTSVPPQIEAALSQVVSSHKLKIEMQRMQMILKDLALKEANHANRVGKEIADLASAKYALDAELTKLTKIEAAVPVRRFSIGKSANDSKAVGTVLIENEIKVEENSSSAEKISDSKENRSVIAIQPQFPEELKENKSAEETDIKIVTANNSTGGETNGGVGLIRSAFRRISTRLSMKQPADEKFDNNDQEIKSEIHKSEEPQCAQQ